MIRHAPPRILFVTGTDTGVGKTLLTALLLAHLRNRGHSALAIKPFCSGGRADVKLLGAVQDHDLGAEEINPWSFAEPVAPLVASRRHRRSIGLEEVIAHISSVAAQLAVLPSKNQKPKIGNRRNPFLLIEGAGGLLAPLGEGYSAIDIIRRLGCETLVVARNRLGTINHTLLTIRALKQLGSHKPRFEIKVVLMNGPSPDPSAQSNGPVLSELTAPLRLFEVPFLGGGCNRRSAVENIAEKHQKLLARILA